eukprot:TRINITY_DN25158_c0_g1_i1.p2 TRINITY_DN25158_c0_g1~~TRINITY_DN25158_c0_g1_i1.p2  ORF type:complete len:141 (-),score=16.84 TRINITY_DN25158_c0_g1_i1:162-584(-)
MPRRRRACGLSTCVLLLHRPHVAAFIDTHCVSVHKHTRQRRRPCPLAVPGRSGGGSTALSSGYNEDFQYQQLRRRLLKLERIVTDQEKSIEHLKSTLNQLLEVTDEMATVINIQRCVLQRMACIHDPYAAGETCACKCSS